MDKLLESIKKACEQENWYVALFASITLFDIAGKIEYPTEKSAPRYLKFYNSYMPSDYKKFISGEDLYALRCAVLHEGSTDITKQVIQKTLNKIEFITTGPHLIYIDNPNQSNNKILYLDIKEFCLDLCSLIQKWQNDIAKDTVKQEAIKSLMEVYDRSISQYGIRIG